jgi:hypothetical protein
MRLSRLVPCLAPVVLLACAAEGESSSSHSDAIVEECPALSPPAPGFCPPGERIVPVKDGAGACTVGFACKPECPTLSPPGPGFCGGGPYQPIVEDGCTVGFECKPECPTLSPPGPGFCDGGSYQPIVEDGCTVAFECT